MNMPEGSVARGRRLALVVGLSVAAAGGTAAPAWAQRKPDVSGLTTRQVDVTARQIVRFNRAGRSGARHGRLDFIGGLVLKSEDKAFGGWSGIAVDPNGKGVLAVSDAGVWMRAQLIHDSRGRPTGLEAVSIGPIVGTDGKMASRSRDSDAEAVVIVSGTSQRGEAMIAYEQNHQIATVPIGARGLERPRKSFRPRSVGAAIPTRDGIEALTVLKGGRYKGVPIAFAEKLRDGKKRQTGWLFVKGAAQAFTLEDIGGYDITDVAASPDGGILLLERRFRWFEGIKMRIRRITVDDIAPGRHVTGEVLLEASLVSNIDNMEGLAVHPGPDGALILTVISDDNFDRVLQRTMLLQFRLPAESASKSKPQRP
ncbi:MAG: esterase-like activity of phytase family protein [Hyphomicrobiaceae bacterium]|nr:esterase-like activity of phytase family protein [Hyphomicrobiaceae bacterium]